MKNIVKLTMLLVFVLGGYGAMAQDATHAVGSKHTFKVNVTDTDGDHTGNTYTWNVYMNDGNDTPAEAGTNFSFVGDASGVDIKTVEIQWLIAGNYLVELSEENKVGSCSTVRRVNIKVTGGAIDLLVLASDKVGATVTGDALTTCNDESGNIITAQNFGNSTRYFTVSMTTDGQDWMGAWSFNYTVNVAGATVDLVTATQGGVSEDKVTVNADNNSVVLAVTVANTPGIVPDENITLNLVASSAVITTAGGNTAEDVANLGNNTPESHVINPSPNTTTITIE